jgi:hypothetical protein
MKAVAASGLKHLLELHKFIVEPPMSPFPLDIAHARLPMDGEDENRSASVWHNPRGQDHGRLPLRRLVDKVDRTAPRVFLDPIDQLSCWRRYSKTRSGSASTKVVAV